MQKWERAGFHDTQHHCTVPFGRSSLIFQELGVSCLLLTTVHASVQISFPYPIPRPPTCVLIAGSTQLTLRLCAEAQGVYPQLHTPRLPKEHVRTRTCRSRHGSGREQDTSSGCAHLFSADHPSLPLRRMSGGSDRARVSLLVLKDGSLWDTAPQTVALRAIVRDS